MEPEELGKSVKKIIGNPKKLYAIALVLIVLFPPIATRDGRPKGWSFITDLEPYRIDTTYLIIEFVVITVIYYLFRKKS